MNATLLRNLMCSVLLCGCGLTLDTAPDEDAGSGPAVDASIGAADAGTPPDDAGIPPVMDGSVSPDDAGTSDGGPPDAGCFDADRDGVTTCAGDCDDADPTVFPGAPIRCGDGVDNQCLGVGDESSCMGLGTYVSADTGADTNPGTMAAPVQTILAGQTNARAIGGGVDVYVAEGHYTDNVTMADGIAIRCGYDPVVWTRDITAHLSTIRSSTPSGVRFVAGTGRDTELDGCTVVGQSGVTLSNAITFDATSSGVVRECTVIGPDNESGQSIGIAIYAAGSDATAIDNRGSPLIVDNTIRMGRARTFGAGPVSSTIGILANRTNVEVYRNRVELVDQQTAQRGLLIRFSLAGSKVEDNVIRPSGSTRSDYGTGIVVVGGALEVSRNDVFTGRCVRFCAGVEVLGTPTNLVVVNNQVFAGESESGLSAGILFEVEGATAGAIVNALVHSNLVVGAPTGSPATGIGWINESAARFVGGRVMSNIIYSGGGGSGYALWESGANYDPERLEANMLSFPPSGGSGTSLYLDEGSIARTRIADVNLAPEHMGVPSRDDDCGVIDPRPDGDPHLPAGSTCIDMGTSNEAPPLDWDDEPRPRGANADPGVDEAR
ncbi:MAG: hypothetical protein H6719_19585 [Sandaracinaceae bacterium]|nr:hypothetical protein [Sandaracinaceae bacterium]